MAVQLRRSHRDLSWDASTEAPRQYYTFAHPPCELVLDSGQKLGPITVAYETYGQLNAAGDNAILIAHALTGDSHVASHAPGEREGWWEPLVGTGRAFDTSRYFVVCSNVLGGCQGTTGPSSPDPKTGRPWGMRFPVITIRDMVRVQRHLLDYLGVRRLAAVAGGSMGGLQVLEWAVTYPELVEKALVFAAPGRISPQAIAYNEVMRQAIMLDPAWQGGDYQPGQGPARGLAVARMLGMITYQSCESMNRKFGRAFRGRIPTDYFSFQGQFEVESYLHYQGQKLVRRFDANSYLYLTRAMDLFDLGLGRGGYEEALKHIQARTLVVGISSDILYPAALERELVEDLRRVGVEAEYVELQSPFGHDAFLIEFEQVGAIISDFLWKG
ncbi:MAG: homoserine O-acetyltransferase [Bacillota bacterium]|nr:homoserine O-acetyltransferase [Bacillota bacterium]